MPTSSRPRSGLAPLVAIEGIDGVGKSALLDGLTRRLRRKGLKVGRWKEPSRNALGRAARRASANDPAQAAFLFTLDRGARKVELRALRTERDIVLSDRSFYSTLAYQGSALHPSERSQLEELQRTFADPPDRVLWLDLDPRRALERVDRRGATRAHLEQLAILRRARRAYASYARTEPGLFHRLDASRSQGEVLEAAEAVLWSSVLLRNRRARLPRRRKAL